MEGRTLSAIIRASENEAAFAFEIEFIRLGRAADSNRANESELELELERQTRFLSVLHDYPHRLRAELRYLFQSRDPFRVRAYLVLFVPGPAREAEALSRFIREATAVELPLHSFREIEDPAEARSLVYPFEPGDRIEIHRRSEDIALDSDRRSAQRTIGFGEGTETAISASPDTVFHVYPYIESKDRRERLCSAILACGRDVLLRFVVEPTTLSSGELAEFAEALALCERYAQAENELVAKSSGYALALKRQAELLFGSLAKERSAQLDNCFACRIIAESPVEVPFEVVVAAGTGVSEHALSHAGRAERDCGEILSGGWDWKRIAPGSPAEASADSPTGELARHSRAKAGFERRMSLCSMADAATAFRLPIPDARDFPGIPTIGYRAAPPPLVIPRSGLLVGSSKSRGVRREVFLQEADRLRHLYVAGSTGTGKSTLLENMVVEDMRAGNGLAIVDPHGELVEEILALVPPGREDDVIYVNPADIERPVGINLLDAHTPLERDFIVNYFTEMFYSMWDKKEIGGPMFETYLRNSLLLLLHQAWDYTPNIVDIVRLFTDDSWRRKLSMACTNDRVKEFWIAQAERITHEEISIKNISPYITSKFHHFIYNETLGAMFGQSSNTIPFADAIESRKIMLFDLRRGVLGETNSRFVSMIVVGIILRTIFARASRSRARAEPPFYLYVDEFQSVATPSFMTMLAESRKYGLGLVLANQYLGQLPEDIANAVLGNIGSYVAFRSGAKDAELFSGIFGGGLDRQDFMNLPNYRAYARLLMNGEILAPFDIETPPPPGGSNPEAAKRIMEASSLRYGLDPGRPMEKAPDPPSPPFASKDEETDVEEGLRRLFEEE